MKRSMYRAWSDDAEAAKAFFRAYGEVEQNPKIVAALNQAGVTRISLFESGGHWLLYMEKEAGVPAEFGEQAGKIAQTESDRPKKLSDCEPLLANIQPRHGDIQASFFEFLFPGLESVLALWPGEPERRIFVPMSDIFHYRRDTDPGFGRRTLKTESCGRLARLRSEKVSSYVFYHYQYQEEKPGDGDKYGIIALHEQWLFFYAERPATIEAAPYEGSLNTRRTPNDWGAVMRTHFIPWTDASGDEEIWLNLNRVLEFRAAEEERE
ncbi:hypothetical protein [Saccharibacillus sacchari]|uniref:Uncharacterized protein n=1 Tax=Saccharibacillus sacchari TaxID=456493 RepID=A0ACC6PDN7_9BACL